MVNILNYMLKFTTYSFILLMWMELLNCQESPCPRVFLYKQDLSNNLHGVITVPTPTNHNNLFLLEVELSLGNTLGSQNLDNNIQFMGTAEDVKNRRPLIFQLEFPTWDKIPPKITSISLNNRNLCQGEPVHQTGNLNTSKVYLSYTLTIKTTTFDNFEDNNPTKKENDYYGQHPNKINANPVYNDNFPYNRKESPQSANNFRRNYPINNNNLYVYSYDYDQPDNQYYYDKPPVINTELTNQPPFPYHDRHQNSDSNPIFTTPDKPVPPVKNDNNFDSCGKPMSSSQLIANGNDVKAGAHPWIGALFIRKNASNIEYLCGASLITKRIALTAGHCVSKYSDADLRLVFGRINVNDWFEENDQRRKVEKAVIHPDYNEETSDADIAVLHFSNEVIFTSTVSPVCLWESESDLKGIINQTGVVVGWGQDENYKSVDILQQLYVPVVSEEVCLWADARFTNITSNRTFCAGKNDGTGPCSGDSGSGFYFNLQGKWTIRGIVSRSLVDLSGRCNLKQYAVYLDVAKYIQWIHTFL